MLMQHTTFSTTKCPIALSLERVGGWWSIMILRDAFRGLQRFDQFQKSLGIAPNILSRRLRGLVDAGLMEKSRYSEHPPRYAYLLTERGRDFRPVLRALLAWGSKHCVPSDLAPDLAPDLAQVNTAPPTTGDDDRRTTYRSRKARLHIIEVRTQP
jgi:DNA-binding HxlR family transcriptional regulator